MSFEDIARRMKDARKPTRAERLHELWTGEAPEIPLHEPVKPAAPQARTRTLVGAYVLLALGVLVALAGALPVVLWWDHLSRWEVRGGFGVVAVGIALVVQSTRLFTAAAQTAPLPGAQLRR